MERALAAIPDRQRIALILAEVQELSGVELAAALGVSHVAARALLTRARESLRQALAVARAETAVERSGDARRVATARQTDGNGTPPPEDRDGRDRPR
jgi:predicted RNA polymerase sigma factor